MNLKNLPKVELHLHLDGSIRPQTASELLNINIEEVEKNMIAQAECNNLNDYLTKFDLPEKIMQTKDNLKRVAKELAEDLKKENVIYAEIRFAPMKHIKKGLSGEDVIDSILSGLKEIDIKTNLILCMMRGSSYEENIEVINLAKKYLNKGVCAIDLAGAEALYKTYMYENLFDKANKLGIPFTIHAGEADGKDSIKSAISFGAKRIGHGIRIVEDEELIKKVIEKNILLEICPTSNIQTRCVNSYKEHPIKKLLKKGIPISINTDNRTVSNTTLTVEYEHLINELAFTVEDIINTNKMAINHAFISNDEKYKLLNAYNNFLNN